MKRSRVQFLTLTAVILVLFFCISCDDSNDDDDTIDDSAIIDITSLLAITGSSSSFGESCGAAIELAEADINEWFRGQTGNWWVKNHPVDTGGDPETALEILENLPSYNYNFVIGPNTSSEAAYIREYVNENDILIVSPSSVAISLALPDDNLFRFVTDDTYQAKAMSALLLDDNVDVVIPLTRDDVWGNDLLDATTTEFEVSGGTVLEGLKYNPETDDFASTMETFSQLVENALTQYPQMKIGVYALTFGEIESIYEAIADNQTLLGLDWYGGSATAKNANLLSNMITAQVAATVGFPCSVYGDHSSTEFAALKTRLEAELGREPESYAFAAYDAAWVAAKTYFELGYGDHEFTEVKAKFIEICETYVGVTGPVSINDAGDREFGNYDFWAIVENEGTYEWVKTARYEINPVTFDGTLVRY